MAYGLRSVVKVERPVITARTKAIQPEILYVLLAT
jgi:hypothetical protein